MNIVHKNEHFKIYKNVLSFQIIPGGFDININKKYGS